AVILTNYEGSLRKIGCIERERGRFDLARRNRKIRAGGKEREHLGAVQRGCRPNKRHLGQQLRPLPLGAKTIELCAFSFALAVPKNSDDTLDIFQTRSQDRFPLLGGEHAVESLPEAVAGLPERKGAVGF